MPAAATRDDDAVRWQIAPVDQIRFEPLNALTLAFDRRSGQTHMLASPLPEICQTLRAGPATTDAIAQRLAEQFEVTGEGDTHALVAERLTELAAMGLVERL